MAHPFQQRKLLVTVCKAEIGWYQPESTALQSGYVTLVTGPFRASTRSVPATRKARAGAATLGSPATGAAPGVGQQLNWAPSLGPELFVLTEDCLLVADLVIGAELWGQRGGGRWNSSDSLYAQSEICLDVSSQALLMSGRCLEVRLPLMQGLGGKGKGSREPAGCMSGGGSSGRGSAAAAAAGCSSVPVLGILALSMLLQPADAEAAVARHLPPDLVPRLLLDTSRLLPGAVVRGAVGTAYVDPCVMFLRIRLVSASGLARGGHEGGLSRSSTPGHTHRQHYNHSSQHPHVNGGLPGHMQELGAKLQAHMGRTMSQLSSFINRLKEQHSKSRGATPSAPSPSAQPPTPAAGVPHQSTAPSHQPPLAVSTSAPETVAVFNDTPRRTSTEGPVHGVGGGDFSVSCSVGGRGEVAVNRAAAETVMSLLESNGFAVVDNRRLSKYFWCKVSYEGQNHTSRLTPVTSGTVRWDEMFVMAALRPARNAPLEIELYGSNDSKSRGKVVCQLSVPLCDLLDQVLRDHHQRQTERSQQLLAQELREQQQLMQYKEVHEHQQQEYQQQQRCHRRGWWSAVPSGAQAVKSAFNAIIAVPAAGDGLPPYHPDTWPRGRVALTARIGGPGGASAVTHGPSMGSDGAARECRFLFEVEVVDADPRAVANNTHLLPGAQPPPPHNSLPISLHQQKQPHQLHSLQDGAPGRGVCQEGTLNGGPVVRQGCRLSRAGEGLPEGLLSPPWSPTAVSQSRMGGDVGMLTPACVGIGEVLSPRPVATASFPHEAAVVAAAVSIPRSSVPAAGVEDLWLRPKDLPYIHSHVAEGTLDDEDDASSVAAATASISPAVSVDVLLDSTSADIPATADASSMSGSMPPTAPETGVPCTPTAHFEGTSRSSGATGVAAAEEVELAAEPPPGLCSAAALASITCATLSLVCHDLALERPMPPDISAAAGSGNAVSSQGAQHAAAGAAITQGDYFIAIRCGAVWVTTNNLRVVGAGAGGCAGAGTGVGGCGGDARLTPHLGLVAPLLKPSALISLALFRRTNVVAGKKILNVRTMIGMLAAEQMVGKLRLRASSLVPGRAVTVCLPLKAERSGPRPCATVARCRVTLLLSLGPMGLPRLIAAYSEPPTHHPVAMLQAGAVSGPGQSPTLPLTDPSQQVELETLRRRERRLLIKWVSESCPGLSASALRKLVEDGRTEFNLGRTTQNWRRIARSWSSTEPLGAFWSRVQSWSFPPLTLAVALGEVALLMWPSRTLAVAALLLAVRMWAQKGTLTRPGEGGEGDHGLVLSGHHLHGSGRQDGVGGPLELAAGGSGDGEVAGSRGSAAASAAGVAAAAAASPAGSYFGEPPAMVEDINNDPEVTSTASTGTTAATNAGGGGGGGGGDVPVDAISASTSTSTPTVVSFGPLPTAAAGLSAATPAAMPSSRVLPSAASTPISIPPSPSAHQTSAAMAAAAASSSSMNVSMTATAAGWIFGSSPPSGGAAATIGNEWAVHQQTLLQRGSVGGGGSEVPKDPLGALRQQYDQLMYFGLRVQNVLDDIAGAMERLQALFSWRDPMASACFVAGLVLMAVALWTVGMRIVLGCVLLYDLRPPRWRDPWLPPPANIFAQLPTRADLMM